MKKFLLFVFIFVALAAAALTALLRTTAGSKLVIRQAILRYVPFKEGGYETITGSILEGIMLEDLALFDIKGLPAGNVLRIQRFTIDGKKLLSGGLIVEIDNARLRFKASDPLVLNGSLKDGELDFSLYGPGVGINEIKDFAELVWLKPYAGTVLKLDFFVNGTLEQPLVSGGLFVEELHRGSISLFQMPLTCDLAIRNLGANIQLFGSVTAMEGWLHSRRTRVLLKESTVIFDGDPRRMKLNLRGESNIEDVVIAILIEGTRENPEINLSSQPPLPRDALMVMLATGKRWASLENTVAGGPLSPEIASDFVDFLFFNGQGGKFAQRFGLKDIHVTYNENKQGIGVTKTVTSKADVGYGLEKTEATLDSGAKTVQTIEGQYKFTDKVSVELEKKLESQDQTNTLENEPGKVQSEDKIMLKFRTKF